MARVFPGNSRQEARLQSLSCREQHSEQPQLKYLFIYPFIAHVFIEHILCTVPSAGDK